MTCPPRIVLILSLAAWLPATPLADTSWPRAWFEAAPTASHLDIRSFSESPYLKDRNLPPLKQRLPTDPLVSVPLGEPGQFGGVARISDTDSRTFYNVEGLITISADHKTLLPNLAESWRYSQDGRALHIRLREGVKWSDGQPLTSDDFVFMIDDLIRNTEYAPVVPRLLQGMTISKSDALNFTYHFEAPSPLFVNIMAQFPEYFVAPKHHYQQFHPKYRDPQDLDEYINSLGFINWASFIETNRRGLAETSVDAPTLRAHRLVKMTPTLNRYERNPYYFKVDPEGRQLPYIDEIHAEIISDDVIHVAKASTGQLDFAAYSMPTEEIPLLKLGESTNGIDVKVWKRLHGSDIVLQPNYNHADKRLTELYWDRRFRIALSVAINREEMNQIIYFGRGVPRQVTVIPTSDYFEPEFARAHIQFDPAHAVDLLDEIGLKDLDGDGLREYPDGEQLTITIEYIDFETPKQISLELISHYWRAVGIDLRLRPVDQGLQWRRAPSGEMQMTAWHADRTTDILFPLQPDWWVPNTIAWSMSMWNEWTRWYLTEGRLGTEPPQNISQLHTWFDTLRSTMDEALRIKSGKAILRSSAENLWSIGTVGLAPHPVVVSSRLRGVPDHGIWGWDTRWTLPYHPETWYLAD